MAAGHPCYRGRSVDHDGCYGNHGHGRSSADRLSQVLGRIVPASILLVQAVVGAAAAAAANIELRVTLCIITDIEINDNSRMAIHSSLGSILHQSFLRILSDPSFPLLSVLQILQLVSGPTHR